MKSIPIYQVDAFSKKVFSGNPAAVCILDKWLSDKVVSDSIWWHMVDVIIPNEISSDNALLFIGGGSKNDKKIFLDTTTIKKAQEK